MVHVSKVHLGEQNTYYLRLWKIPTKKNNNKFIYLSINSLVQSCGLNGTLPGSWYSKSEKAQQRRTMHVPGTTKRNWDLPVALCVSAEAHPWFQVKFRGLQFWSSVWPWCRRAPEMKQQRHGTIRFPALRNCEKIMLKCYRTKGIMNTFKR